MASRHEARITETNGSFYALVVRIDRDGQENVCHGFSGHYASRKNAEKAAAKFIAKLTA
jgi:hypothetical protein